LSTATTDFHTLSLHDALPISHRGLDYRTTLHRPKLIMEYLLLVLIDIIQSNIDIAAIILLPSRRIRPALIEYPLEIKGEIPLAVDRKSTRLNSSHVKISYAVF